MSVRCLCLHLYEGDPESKERFAIPRYSLIITEKLIYKFRHLALSTIPHVAFDIKALVPWHQFVYTIVIPCGCRQHSSGIHHLRSVYQKGAPSFLETVRSTTVPGLDCAEDALRCPTGIAHAARLVSAGQYADMHCRVTEQSHARACLFGKII